MGDESIFQKLKDELEEIRVRQLDPLLIHRHIFQQFACACSPYAGSYHGGALSGWIAANYIAYAATTVRRMVEHTKDLQKRKKVYSLVNFLLKVQQHVSLFSRQGLRQKNLENCPDWACDEMNEVADRVFEFGVGEEGLDRLTDEVVQSDIGTLEKSAKHVITIANNWIAHDSKKPRVSTLRLGDLDSAIDELNTIYVRYFGLVTGNTPPGPPLDRYNCEQEFHRIWPPK